MLENASTRPSHITEIVGPDLPHYYGYVDFAAVGMGGVWLPATRWLQPLVWRVKTPPDIETAVRLEDGYCNNNDSEAAAAVFVAEAMLDHLLLGDTAGVAKHLNSDNSSTVGWNQRMASRASHKAPERFLRLQAMRQRWTRRGPSDCQHVAGKQNEFGDFPSRSYEENFPADTAAEDAKFLTEFQSRHPLPPQLGSWRLVQPPAAIVSVTFSLLRNQLDMSTPPATSSGADGLALPSSLADTLFSKECKAMHSTWNEAGCSWPLLSASGKVTTAAVEHFQQRRSRQRFAGAEGAWSTTDLETLAAKMRASTPSTNDSQNN